jgi:hypothetical protein
MSFMVFAFLRALSVTYAASASREATSPARETRRRRRRRKPQSFESTSPHATGLIATSASAAVGALLPMSGSPIFRVMRVIQRGPCGNRVLIRASVKGH